MAHFDHSFGIEIECYLPADNTNKQALAQAISQRLGRPESCVVEAYGHSTPRGWKIVTDGSLGNYERGVEIVSPVLINQEGLDQVATVCRALNDFGCTVKKSCGFHVHVGVGDASLDFWKGIVSLYSVFERVIDGMMPNSRRASLNSYCLSLTRIAIDRIQTATSFLALRALLPGRYYKVNLAAYERHRTVEFRQHSGTTDAQKACNWVITCLKMVDRAKQGFNAGSFANRPRNMARPGTKNYEIGQLLLRPEGVTSQEALRVTGWTSISIAEIAGICGINFTRVKRGRITTFFAVQSAPINATVDSFATAIGLSAEERAYVQQRTNDLSGAIAWAA